jgi:diphthamide biosynthesis protein 4
MVLATTICIPKTLNEVLSVTEDATYDEIRAAYKSAALNTHPDKSTDNSPVIG